MKTIERKAKTDICYIEPGGSHDKIKKKSNNSTVTVVPRHKCINPNTCRKIIKDIKQNCF